MIEYWKLILRGKWLGIFFCNFCMAIKVDLCDWSMKEQILALTHVAVFQCLLLHAVRQLVIAFPFVTEYYIFFFFLLESRIEGWLSIPNRGNIKRYGWPFLLKFPPCFSFLFPITAEWPILYYGLYTTLLPRSCYEFILKHLSSDIFHSLYY